MEFVNPTLLQTEVTLLSVEFFNQGTSIISHSSNPEFYTASRKVSRYSANNIDTISPVTSFFRILQLNIDLGTTFNTNIEHIFSSGQAIDSSGFYQSAVVDCPSVASDEVKLN